MTEPLFNAVALLSFAAEADNVKAARSDHAPDNADQNIAESPNNKTDRWGCGIVRHSTLWLKPQLVGQFEYVEWTPDGICASYCTSC